MRFDYSKLRGKIVEKFGNYTNFCDKIGWTTSELSSKLSNKRHFTVTDIYSISKVLELQTEEIGAFFYTPEVSEV